MSNRETYLSVGILMIILTGLYYFQRDNVEKARATQDDVILFNTGVIYGGIASQVMIERNDMRSYRLVEIADSLFESDIKEWKP